MSPGNAVNLCDPSQEPSDEELGQLMDSVALDVVRRNALCDRKLCAEIDREISKTVRQAVP